MQRLLAITGLTLKAALRYRLLLVLAVILFAGVVILPLSIKDVGTAQGFTQLLLTYTLAFITTILGFATLWLACGTLARDVEECQMQVVAVKPIARWQIWLGKWLGILTLNAILLGLSTGTVFFLMKWRAERLPAREQEILRNEVMVARSSVKEPVEDVEATVEQELKRRLQQTSVAVTDIDFMRKQLREQVRAGQQIVPPERGRRWQMDLGFAKPFVRDQPLSVRFKFNTAQNVQGATYLGTWEVGVPESTHLYRTNMSLAADTFYEFAVPPNLYDDQGVLTVIFYNYNEEALLFSLEEGMEVLYREAGFGVNFFRGVCIIFFWLAFLAALGLTAASFLSFPVAAFVSLGVLIVGFSSGTISLVLEQGTIFEVNHDTGLADEQTAIDYVALPIFRALLFIINLVRGFSPIDSLSSGRSIGWGQLGVAFTCICLIMSGIVALIGMVIFSRRELAATQGNN